MKKWIIYLLAAVLMLNAGAVTAFAEETEPEVEAATAPVREPGFCGESLQWSFENGVLTVSGTGRMDDFPEGAPWEEHLSRIRELRLIGGVSTVGAYAFTDCDSLQSLDLGDSLTEVGKAAFSGCDGLTEVELPAGFRIFGEESFSHCSNLKTFRFAGGMPSFRLNCLWDTYAKLIYPASRPWPLQHIEQLESAFQGRIEFLASDGTDPYVPEEDRPETAPTEIPTEPPTEAPTEAPAEGPAEEPATVPTEAPAEAPTVPAAEVTEQPSETVPPVPETTEEYVVLPEPEAEKPHSSKILPVALIALMVLSGGGVLFMLGRMSSGRKKKFDGDFSEILLEDERKKPTQAQKAAGKKTGKKPGKYRK